MKTIGVLITCYNRRQKTINCLKSLYSCELPVNYLLDVFLVDDASSDGTSQGVKENFPQVRVISGNGHLFWNKGMRLAWETATQINDYDFYLWLNDDTILDGSAIFQLLQTYEEIYSTKYSPAILCGACRISAQSAQFSYGGRTNSGPVIPNGKIQSCQYINGNVVLVSREIFHKLGSLSPDYTHGMGDVDYGLRAMKENFPCYTTKQFIAVCPPNEGIADWCNPQIPLKKRWELFHSPKGLNIREYIVFRKRFWGRKWILYAVKAFFKVITPGIYSKLISN
ncbi:MAG TPA: glycosyltransferase family 2 protein [Prolixibacteraceae bacterium]|nr:glycosyltransferase family 2 protein [Prolixibacteraceae bacterium]